MTINSTRVAQWQELCLFRCSSPILPEWLTQIELKRRFLNRTELNFLSLPACMQTISPGQRAHFSGLHTTSGRGTWPSLGVGFHSEAEAEVCKRMKWEVDREEPALKKLGGLFIFNINSQIIFFSLA